MSTAWRGPSAHLAIARLDRNGLLSGLNSTGKAYFRRLRVKHVDSQPFADSLPDPWRDRLHALLRTARKSGCPSHWSGRFDDQTSIEISALPSDQDGFWVLCRAVTHKANPTTDLDLEESSRILSGASISQRFERAELLFNYITSSISDVFWISDPNIENGFFVSKSYEKVWGRSLESFYKDPFTFVESVHPDDRQRVIAKLSAQRNGQPFEHQYRIVTSDGEIRWILDRGFPIRSGLDSEKLTFVGIAQDITASKNLIAAEAKSKLLDASVRLAGEVAHEYNNIFSAIEANIDDYSFNARDASEILARIAKHVRRGTVVTKALQASARRRPLVPHPTSVSDLIARALTGADSLNAQSIPFATDGQPASVDVDIQAWVECLGLLFDAMRPHAKGRDAKICWRRKPDRPSAGPDPGEPSWDIIEIAIRWPASEHEIEREIGLPLLALEGLAFQSKGDFSVNVANGMAHIVISLPGSSGGPHAPTSESAPEAGLGASILLVDDEPDLLAAMRQHLQKSGFRVVAAAGVAEAWKRLEEEGPTDLLLTDQRLGPDAGDQFAALAAERFPGMKIMFLTGFSASIDRRLGDWPILEKPISPARLLAAIQSQLATPHSTRP